MTTKPSPDALAEALRRLARPSSFTGDKANARRILAAYDTPAAVELRRLERAVIDAALAYNEGFPTPEQSGEFWQSTRALEAHIASAGQGPMTDIDRTLLRAPQAPDGEGVTTEHWLHSDDWGNGKPMVHTEDCPGCAAQEGATASVALQERAQVQRATGVY